MKSMFEVRVTTTGSKFIRYHVLAETLWEAAKHITTTVGPVVEAHQLNTHEMETILDNGSYQEV